MKFKVDENWPHEVAARLRQSGYDAVTVQEQSLTGASDMQLASVCQSEGRIWVTMDTDFADLCEYPPAHYPGLIVLRLKRQDKPHLLDVVGRLIPLLSSETLEHHLWIVEEGQLRIRG